MAPKRLLLLLAASVVAALDANAPASLVSDCTVPASAYDELFVELHFFAPSLRWVHLTHSMKQAFDVQRQLRACGLPMHAWP